MRINFLLCNDFFICLIAVPNEIKEERKTKQKKNERSFWICFFFAYAEINFRHSKKLLRCNEQIKKNYGEKKRQIKIRMAEWPKPAFKSNEKKMLIDCVTLFCLIYNRYWCITAFNIRFCSNTESRMC